MSRSDTQMKLRVPLDLREDIERAARLNERSLNGEIVFRLRQQKTASAPTA